MEPLDRPGRVERLFVSNASGKISNAQKYKRGIGALMRLISIAKYQIEALRGRDVVRRFQYENLAGNYFDTGNTCQGVLKSALKQLGDDAGYGADDIPSLCRCFLSPEDTERAASISTEIEITPEDFKLLFRHGYEVADCTMFAYGKGDHKLLKYDSSKWSGILT